MPRWLTVVEALEVPCPPAEMLPAIWDIQNVQHVERKADTVAVHPDGNGAAPTTSRATSPACRGRGALTTSSTRPAFTAVTPTSPATRPPSRAASSSRPSAPSTCTVIHYEQYVLSPWLAPIAPLVQRYLRRSMRRELRDLRRMVTGTAEDAPAPRRTRAGTVGLRRA